ncbi:hypothetical protein LTS18_009936, partial [Coniosporium uncinatum]
MSEKESKPASGGGDSEADLETILDDAQRDDLTLLVCNITESMRHVITDNFDAAAALDPSLLREGNGMSDEEKMMSAPLNPSEVAKVESEKKRKEEVEKELSSPEMKTLKQSALEAYDEWRKRVIQRVGQVANSEKVAKEQLQSKSDPKRSASNAGSETTDTPKFQE